MHVKNLADEEIVEMTVDDEPTDLLIRAPSLTTYMQYVDEPCLAIVDTGCQRQVAGKRWHAAHAQHVGLPRLSFKEKTMFRFGPHNGSSSRERFAYPAALGGSLAVMFFSRVDEDDPALMSRQCLVDLDALPDISKGKMHYRALGATTNLYLSSCGHLAVRLDEWPAQMPPWPFSMPLNHKDLPDVWSPGARELCSSAPSS